MTVRDRGDLRVERNRSGRAFTPLGWIQRWGSFIRFSHSVFALPFALAAMAVAARDTHGWPGWRLFSLIVAATVAARACAMAFNRIVDRHFDKANARTARRHLPTGEITLAGAWTLCLAGALGLAAAAFFINGICFLLSPVALAIVCFYSLTKRFTDFTHLYLGAALALAPLGAWLAVRGSLSISPIVLAFAVAGWLTGFDIIYAIQDHEFDSAHRLGSLVVRWGVKNALQFAFLSHMLMWGLLVLFGLLCHFRFAYWLGLLLILFCLAGEHWLARRRGLQWIQTAFFRLNALVSVVFLTVTVIEVAVTPFRARP